MKKTSFRPQAQSRPSAKPSSTVRLYGKHAVLAALANTERRLIRLYTTREAASSLALPSRLDVRIMEAAELKRLGPEGAPLQGLILETHPLDAPVLHDVLSHDSSMRPLLVLDQVTDPHNIGAILRSAVAFNALAMVTQDRHAPPETGALAKSASGCLELMPWVRVTNLSRALEEIAEAGFWRIGLAGEATRTLGDALGNSRPCLVLGAEGEGLRPNVADHCDELARLPISPRVESLNVSNAAAIALYAAATRSM